MYLLFFGKCPGVESEIIVAAMSDSSKVANC